MPILDLFTRKRVCQLLVNQQGEITAKYNQFMDFLVENRTAMGIVSELEHLYYEGGPFTLAAVASRYQELLAAVRALTAALNALSRGKYKKLSRAIDRIDLGIAAIFAPRCLLPAGELVLPLEALGPEMVRMAGAKATNLALIQKFLGAPVPPGFVITARATHLFFQETGLAGPVGERLARLSLEAPELLDEASRAIRDLVLEAEVPASLAAEILQAYLDLEARTHPNVRLAMRSSAVGEDSEASFAGQYETVLNVTADNLLTAYKQVLASKYSPRAIAYRLRYGLEDWDTLMCVAGIMMVEARASGVLYTVDPARPDANRLKVSAIWGLGEHLVSGEAAADEFFVDKQTGTITRRLIGRKAQRLVNLEGGGTRLAEVPAGEQDRPCLDDETVLALARYGLRLEEYFQGPQDVEWAVDPQGRLYLLQSRPLGLIQARAEKGVIPQDFPEHPVLLAGGQVVSPGIAGGQVFLAEGEPGRVRPPDAILVCRTASPDHARLLGQVKGIITEVGSVTSHLASVAREFGVPALFNVGGATAVLAEGAPITLVAGRGEDQGIVYQGLIPELAKAARPARRPIFENPLHRRLRDFLDKVAPLNLTDPRDTAFSPRGCQTIHDVIRFAHEMVMQEMFGLSGEAAGRATSVRLSTDIPLVLHLIDLGGGLQTGLTTCDTITPDHLTSLPMKALWRGFCHPGITWQGAVAVDASNLLTLMARGAAGELPGGESYAILSREYLNLSAKFGYHFANLDAYLSNEADQNHIFLRFAGGAGTYYGKSLRLNFLGNILSRLGFQIKLTGDLLDATLSGSDPDAMEATLDQVGRLLAVSRLLDLAITNEAEVARMIESFFQGEYDFLQQAQEARIPEFYTNTGNWKVVEAEGRRLLQQDGSEYGSILTAGLTNFMGKVMGHKYLEFLDNIEAYFYFPMAIAKDSEVSEAVLKVRVKPLAGSVDQAGGLAFGIRNVNNYFVLRINALEDNLVIFEFVNSRRFQRATVNQEIKNGEWRSLAAEISGNTCKGYLDGELRLEYTAVRPLSGYVGLWTKADSVTYFDELTIEAGGKKRVIEF
ncbi:MAG: PEP-utilizing enzyme [Deltaproteobacteria bacterium]|nr:PEP-utilizing enzyme [Deltaproteobacteria bacterium]